MKFDELGILPRTLQLDRIDKGHSIEAAMVANEAKRYQACKLRYNNTMLQRAQKRKNPVEDSVSRSAAGTCIHYFINCQSSKRVHFSVLRRFHETASIEVTCCLFVFCGKPAGTNVLHDVSTFQVDQRVRESVTLVEDTSLLGKLSNGNMIALEAKYHKCLLDLYSSARKIRADSSQHAMI